jgi:hypothetical protein
MPGGTDPASFRDPDSRVVIVGDEVRRVLSPAGLADYQVLASSGLLDDPRLIATELLPDSPAPDVLTRAAAAVLRHERVPFVSYPYEWTFSMLRDAADSQLALIESALQHNLMLKDATPYNTQFRGATPVFIDIGSFERLRESELWVGYRQFCMQFLYPLLLQATKGIDVQPLLRGSIEGLTPSQMRAHMSVRDRLRRGYLTTVFLHARLDQRDGPDRQLMRKRLARPGLGREIIRANVRKMRKLIGGLRWDPPRTVWTEYAEHNTYSGSEAELKDAFVRDAVLSTRPRLVWDLGANNGRHARIATESAECVVAVDADHATVDRLYRELRAAGDATILPLVVNLADPSPALGWRNAEHTTLPQRGRPDLTLALAVIHHLAITANIPVRDVVRWLADLGAAAVLEFPTREDPMVQKLLRGKRPGLHGDYDRETFERHLADHFVTRRTVELSSGTRVLYLVVPRADRITVTP